MSTTPYVIYALSLADGQPRYVGLTTRGVALRLREHLDEARWCARWPLHRWIRKHGADAVHATVLEVHDSAACLPERERYWIARLSTFAGDRVGGLNSTRGGDGTSGHRHDEETRRRIGLAGTGRTYPARVAASAAARAARVCVVEGCKAAGARSSDRLCKKHARRMDAVGVTDDPVRTTSWNAGRAWSQESRRRMAEASLGQVPWNVGRTATALEVETNRTAQLVRYVDEGERARGRANLAKASHVRWHEARGVTKPGCAFC